MWTHEVVKEIRIILNGRLSAVNVNGIGHSLKGVKGNTDGQGQPRKDAAAGQVH